MIETLFLILYNSLRGDVMIESYNDLVSIGVLILIILSSSIGFIRFNSRTRRREEMDEYYRDLL